MRMFTSDLFSRTPEAAFKKRTVKTIKQRPLKYCILSNLAADGIGNTIRNLAVSQAQSKLSKEAMRAALEVPVNDAGLNIKTLEN